ncbi:MAG: hypothetical protein ABSE22_14085 [Xanthobacteraceae bacterium]|jgi:hypothetical protein
MPNRDVLANPTRRPGTVAAAVSTDAWPVVCFCTLGALMTLYMAICSSGIDAVPRLMAQFPWG